MSNSRGGIPTQGTLVVIAGYKVSITTRQHCEGAMFVDRFTAKLHLNRKPH